MVQQPTNTIDSQGPCCSLLQPGMQRSVRRESNVCSERLTQTEMVNVQMGVDLLLHKTVYLFDF